MLAAGRFGAFANNIVILVETGRLAIDDFLRIAIDDFLRMKCNPACDFTHLGPWQRRPDKARYVCCPHVSCSGFQKLGGPS